MPFASSPHPLPPLKKEPPTIHETHQRLAAWQQPFKEELERVTDDQNMSSDPLIVESTHPSAATSSNGGKSRHKEPLATDTAASSSNGGKSRHKEQTLATDTAMLQQACSWMDSSISQLQAELDKSIRDRSKTLINLSQQSKGLSPPLPPPGSPGSPRKVRLKVHDRNTIRIVRVDDQQHKLSFQNLKKRIANDYNIQQEFTMKYIDQDDDLICLSSQNDLTELLSLTLHHNMNTINVYIIRERDLTTLEPVLHGSHRHQLHVLSPLLTRATTTTTTTTTQKSSPRIKHWRLGKILGRGAFGIVHLGFNTDNGDLMAVKVIDTTNFSRNELMDVVKEIKVLSSSIKKLDNGTEDKEQQQQDQSGGTNGQAHRQQNKKKKRPRKARLKHPNIVQYLGMEQTDQKLCIFLEYVPGGSLKDLIMNFGPLNTNLLRVYTRQMLLGLEYLHHRGIAHRDLKAANILITNTGVIKIGKQFASNL